MEIKQQLNERRVIINQTDRLPFNYHFIISIVLMGLGITLAAKSDLGATAITSLPFVLSQAGPISFGVMTFIFNMLYIIAQKLIMGPQFKWMQYFQIIIAIILSLAIDFWYWLLQSLELEHYLAQMMVLLLGCVTIALSTVIQLANTHVYNPAEGIVLAIAMRTGKNFSLTKTYFDNSLVIMAIIVSLLNWLTQEGGLNGVREGTIITSLIIGPLIKRFQDWKNRFTN